MCENREQNGGDVENIAAHVTALTMTTALWEKKGGYGDKVSK